MLLEQRNPFSLFTFFQLLIFIHRVLGFSGRYFPARCSKSFLLKTPSLSAAKCCAGRSRTVGQILSPSPWHSFLEAREIACD